MNRQQIIQLVLPLVVVAVVIAFRWRRISRAQPLLWRYLWVRPAIFVVIAALIMASAPPLAQDLPWLFLAVVLGGAAGWLWGRAMAIEMHPENGTLLVKGGAAAMLVLVALIVLRLGLRAGLQMEAAAWHIDILLITDISLVFSVALFGMRALEMYLRARRVMANAGPVAAVVPVAAPRRWRLILGTAAVTMVVTILVLAFIGGGARLRTVVCPACQGFARVSQDAYVERSANDAQRQAALAAVADGKARVKDWFGGVRSTPRFFICVSDGCYDALVRGGTSGYLFMPGNIVLSARGTNGEIAAHVMTLEEIDKRGGLAARKPGAIPVWFRQGLAVIVSRQARYLPPAVPQDCPQVYPAALPALQRGWEDAVHRNRMVYAAAACLVRRDLAIDGGRNALVAVLDKVRRGEDGFAQLWHQ
jgi:hypothetical protein